MRQLRNFAGENTTLFYTSFRISVINKSNPIKIKIIAAAPSFIELP
jgi:hypothetical protein